jgi:hypothetical protein
VWFFENRVDETRARAMDDSDIAGGAPGREWVGRVERRVDDRHARQSRSPNAMRVPEALAPAHLSAGGRFCNSTDRSGT